MTSQRSIWLSSVLAGLAVTLSAQAPRPAFEVASIRPNTSELPDAAGGRGGGTIGRRGQRVTAVNTPLRDIIRYAYDLEPFHALEGTSRLLDDRFDITAIVPESSSTVDESRLMLRTLLAERFKLSIRWTTREQPVHTLQLARRDGRLGPAMKPSTVDCDAWRATPRPKIAEGGNTPVPAEEYERHIRPVCDLVYQPFRARIYGGAQPVAQLARILSRLPAVRSPVVDRTGLTGVFDFELTYAPERPAASGDAGPSFGDAPALRVALEEQLGLKLETARAPADVLVVESVQQPTEN